MNIASNLPFFFYSQMQIHQETISNATNASDLECNFINERYKMILTFYDCANSVVLPFLLMFLSSICSIYAIFKSKYNIMKYTSSKQNKRLAREMRFAFTTIFLNFVYLFLCLPNSVAVLVFNHAVESEFYKVLHFIFLMSYGVNFYLFLASNSLFRSVFFRLFSKVETSNRSFT